MSRVSNERLYYVGGEYMAQSISQDDKKYSMRFDQSQSKSGNQLQHKVVSTDKLVTPIKQNNADEPKDLGPTVLARIRERYKEVNKLDSIQFDVLYGFFLSNRKLMEREGGQDKRAIRLKSAMKNAQKIEPELQRKLLCKLQFQKILEYDPKDVCYTLMRQTELIKRDQKIQEEVDRLNKKPQNSKPKKVVTAQAIERLHRGKAIGQENIEEKPKKSLSPSAETDKANYYFGKKLIELYRDRNHTNNQMTVDNLYTFWTGVPDKNEHGLAMKSDNVKKVIRHYMVCQIKQLKQAHHRIMGFDCAKLSTIMQFYRYGQKHNLQRDDVNIPPQALKIFINEFNGFHEEIRKKEQEKIKKTKEKQSQEMVKLKMTALTRPASATPLSILAMPKNDQTKQALQLLKLYPNDKKLKQFLKQKIRPKARRPQEYGVYQPEEEIKIKQWVKSEAGMNPDVKIQQILMSTTMKGFNTININNSSENTMKILAEESLEEDEKWKHMHLDLRRELKILAYKEMWCRTALTAFVEQQMNLTANDIQYLDDNALIEKIVDFIGSQSETGRKNRLAYLSHHIKMQQTKEKFQEKNKNIENDPNQMGKMKRKFYRYLEEKAREYSKNYLTIEGQPPGDSKGHAIVQIYEQTKSFHPQYMEKYFPMVKSDACPHYPLEFKIEFFRLVKEINKVTGERMKKPKSHIWAPTGKVPGEINQNTFNYFVKAYSKDKNQLREERHQDINQSPKKKTDSVWKREKVDDRLKFMMTFDEAKECNFKPIVHIAKI